MNTQNFFEQLQDEFISPISETLDALINKTIPEITKDLDIFKDSYPKVDIVNYQDKIVIIAALNGFKKENVKIEVVPINSHNRNDFSNFGYLPKKRLKISGKREMVTSKATEILNYIIKELKTGPFERTFNLGDNLDTDSIKAVFSEGLLNITILKKKPTESKEESKEVKID